MKPHKRGLVTVLVVLLMITSVFAQDEPKLCSGIELTAPIPAPLIVPAPVVEGMANVQTITFDENCNPVIGPMQTVPIDQLPSGDGDPNLRQTDFGAIVSSEVTTPHLTASATVRQIMWRIGSVLFNEVYESIVSHRRMSSLP